MANRDLDTRLKEIYSDQLLTNDEYQQFRDEADAVFDALKATVIQPNRLEDFQRLVTTLKYLDEFQKLADDLCQSMQQGILQLRKARPSGEQRQALKQAYGYQVAYVKACLDRFTQSL